MKKGDWLTGKDLMNRWGLKPFELIDYIRHSMASDPLEEKLLPCTPATKRPFEIGLFANITNIFRGFNNEGLYFPNKPYLIRDWGELLPYIADCIFISWRVEAFVKKHPELLAAEALKPQIEGDKKVSRKLTDLKLKKEEYLKDPRLIEVIKKVKPEMEFLYNELQEFVGFQYDNNPDREKSLQEEAEILLDNPENKFGYLKKEYFKDKKIYSTDPKQTPRDFIGSLLKKIVKDKLGKTIGGQLLYEIHKEI